MKKKLEIIISFRLITAMAVFKSVKPLKMPILVTLNDLQNGQVSKTQLIVGNFSGGQKTVSNFPRVKKIAGNFPRVKIQLETFH